MFWDIALPVLAALAQALTGFLGWRVTVDGVRPERKKRYEILFGLASLVGVVSVGVVAYRGNQVSGDLADIKRTQQEIKSNPPVLNVPAPVVNIPPPSKAEAKLQFAFWPVPTNERLSLSTSQPIQNGIVTVSFTAKNIGTAQAEKGQIWIQVCDGCEFAAEPEGTTTTDDAIVRRKRFDWLHMGSYFDPTELKIIPPSGATDFSLAFKYACDLCPPVDNKHPQRLKVHIK